MPKKGIESKRTLSPDCSRARISFVKNSYATHRLISIHGEIAGDKRGRRYNVEVLNRSAIILITAHWEAYVEEVCSEFLSFLLSSCSSYNEFPQKGRLAATKRLVDSKDERRVWNLAGDGWKKVIRDYVKKYLDNFHTPNHCNFDDLFSKIFDIRKLSLSWRWAGMSPDKAKINLDEFIDIRHQIAHGRAGSMSVTRKRAETYLNLIETIVQKTDKFLRDYSKKLVNKYPW